MSCLRDCTALFAILLCTAPGCKKQKPADAPATTPTRSPISNPPPKIEPRPATPNVAASGGNDWRDKVIEPPAKTKAPAKAGTARTDGGAPAPKGKDELDAEARAETLKAVDAVLKGATSSIKRCYDQNGVGSGSTTISFRVHRSGHFMTPNVQGVSGAVQRCVGKVLTGLRVQGVKTGSMTVTRKIRFQKWR